MPHFVVKSNGIDGGNSFAVEYHHTCLTMLGSCYDHECFELPDYVLTMYVLDELINMYKLGIRPKKPALAKPMTALPEPEQPARTSPIETGQPRNEMG
jgi:hypothetical protein